MSVGTARAIARKDWLEFVRDRRLLLSALLVALLALAAVASAAVQVAAFEADRRATDARDRQTWEGQGARNPHSVAHFSSWAVKPLTATALLDPGVSPYAGNAVWMEAHNWNPPTNRPIEDEAASIDLGRFSAAWLLQTLVPLLIFAVAAGLVARERERGTLRLMLASGAAPGALLPGKLAGLARVALVLVLPVLAAAGLAVALVGVGPGEIGRLALWSVAYLIFFATVAFVAVTVSARARNAAQATVLLVALWLLAAVLAPRAAATAAQTLAPAPSVSAFTAAIVADTAQAHAGDPDPAAFTAALMRRYGVNRREDLPVSVGGLLLDRSEAVGDRVFDRHYQELATIYGRQRQLARLAAIVSPLAALQNVSTALAGTDTGQQLDFQQQAEAHRRRTIGALNRDMIDHAGAADFDYRAGAGLWRRLPPFRYQPRGLGTALATVVPDLVILLAWAAGALLVFVAAARRLSAERV